MTRTTLLLVLVLSGCATTRIVPRREIPNAALRTQLDQPIRFYDDLVKDRVVLVTFLYTTCKGSCPGTTATLTRVRELLRSSMDEEVTMIAISLEPETDTPEALRRYAEQQGVTGWTFLTGDRKEVERLRQHLGFTDPDPVVDADVTQHAAMVAFGNDRTGRWAAAPVGIGAEQLAEVIGRVAAERR